jgi:hypothetical protein
MLLAGAVFLVTFFTAGFLAAAFVDFLEPFFVATSLLEAELFVFVAN